MFKTGKNKLQHYNLPVILQLKYNLEETMKKVGRKLNLLKKLAETSLQSRILFNKEGNKQLSVSVEERDI